MNTWLGLLQQGLFFAGSIVLSVAVASRVLYPRILSRLKTVDPEGRSTVLFLWCVLPVVSALAVVLSAMLPSLLEIVGLSVDHCLGHPEGHVHFCLVHPPAPVDSLLLWAPGILFAGLLGVMGLNLAVDAVETARFKRRLAAYRSHGKGDGMTVLDTCTPLALTCGVFRQEIFLSTGLLGWLSEREEAMLLAHERAHVARRDALKTLLARTLTLAHFPATRRALLTNLDLACEQACDKSSTRGTGGPGKMAELLLKVERIFQKHFVPGSPVSSAMMGTGPSMLPERIDSLLNPRGSRLSGRFLLLICAVPLVALLTGHDMVHDWLEHFTYLIADRLMYVL